MSKVKRVIHIDDREAEDLPTHVLLCGERYRTLFNKLNRVEKIIIALGGGIILALVNVVMALYLMAD